MSASGHEGQPSENPLRPRADWTKGDPPQAVDAPFIATRAADIAKLLVDMFSVARLSEDGTPLMLDQGSEEMAAFEDELCEALALLGRARDMIAPALGNGLASGACALGPRVFLPEAIQHAVDVLTPEAKDSGIPIQISIDPSLAKSPAGSVYPIVLAAIQNAVEALRGAEPVKGEVHVQAARLTKRYVKGIEITITDDGPGLVEEMEATEAPLFGATTKPGSLGIGLALARNVAELMGGELVFESNRSPEGDRRGAIVRLWYPDFAASDTNDGGTGQA